METFHVNNYKGLKDLELRGLSRVNLIVGRNNVGKSSLLEVLSLYYSGGSVNELLWIIVAKESLQKLRRTVEKRLLTMRPTFFHCLTGPDLRVEKRLP